MMINFIGVDYELINEHITSPLALAGLIATIFFYLLRLVIKKDIFPTLTNSASSSILKLIINRLFTLSLIAMIFGFLGYIITYIITANEGENKDIGENINKIRTEFVEDKGGVTEKGYQIMNSNVKIERLGKDVFYKDINNNPLEGRYKITDERGNYSDLHFKNGKREGEGTEYDYDGRVLKTRIYKDGRGNGMSIAYHQNGKIMKQGNVVNGEEDGKWERFDNTGEIEKIEHYKNGEKTGKWWKKKYYGDSQTYAYVTENYKSNQHFGHSEEKYENGLFRWEREYTNDQTYTDKKYYPNGKIHIISHIKDGNIDGEKSEYSQDGVLLSKVVFKDGELQE